MHLFFTALFWFPFPTIDASHQPSSPDTLVICPPEFRQSLERWIDYRQKQGHQILVRAPSTTPFTMRRQIRALGTELAIQNVVLVGDSSDRLQPASCLTPTDYVTAAVNVHFGSEPEIATDNSFADFDGDGRLDATIGRIPVDSAAQLDQFIDRLIAYEQSSGRWRRRISFVAGTGEFGQLADSLIEQTVKRIVTDLIPAEFETTITFANWRSPWCPDPRLFSQTAIRRMNEGCLFWIYMGHSNPCSLDVVRLPDRCFPILDSRSVRQIDTGNKPPIAVLLSCYSAAADGDVDCLAESLVKQRRGPIAVISSSRVAMPYALSLFSLEMLDGYFDGEATTIGQLILESKRKMRAGEQSTSYHRMVQALGESLSPLPGMLDQERQEHVHLLHLLGDPLTRIKRPQQLRINAPESVIAGEKVFVRGESAAAGRVTVELVCRRDRFVNRPKRRRQYIGTNAAFAEYQPVYDEAQNRVWTRATRIVERGPFSIAIEIPDRCQRECHFRAVLESPEEFRIGSSDVLVNKPQRQQ